MIAALLTLASLPSYDEARAIAIKEQKPLVVFVGVPALDLPSAVVCAVPRWPYEGLKGPGVIVAVPNPRVGLEWADTLPAMSSRKEIEDAVRRALARRAAAVVLTAPVAPFMRGGSC